MSENRPVIIAVVVVGLVVAAVFGYLVLSPDDVPEGDTVVSIPIPEPAVTPPPVAPPEPEIVAPEPVAERIELPPPEVSEPEPAFVLPALEDSDQLIRDGIVGLTRDERINSWVAPNDLIRRFVALGSGIADGQVVAQTVQTLAPSGQFVARRTGDDQYVMDAASYQRYDEIAGVIDSIDARRAAEFYDLISPLLADAYDELGYTEGNFDDAVYRGIGRLLETPVIEEPIALVRPVVMYRYADARLENLSPAQKQLLRMGPANTRVVQAKLKELSLELRTIREE